MDNLKRTLGMREAVTLTAGTVIGVGLFTVGANAVGFMGPSIILATFTAFIVSIIPALLYGEMGAALPRAGGTYNFAARGVGRPAGVLAGWNFVISLVAVTSGEAVAFSFYFKELCKALGFTLPIPESVIGVLIVIVFIIVNYRGIEITGKVQNGMMFFFWGCAIVWFLTMIGNVQIDYFTPFFAMGNIDFRNFVMVTALVWWCFAGYETAVAMGDEIKYPHINIPRAMILAPMIIFVVNALFQWFLVGIVPASGMEALQGAEAPYAEAMTQAGILGFPLILLCLGIAFGGDMSTLNASVAGPSRYLYGMAKDGSLPSVFAKIHPKHKTPYVAVIFLGVLTILLTTTGSIAYIASLSLFADLFYYVVGFIGYIGLRVKFPDMDRPFKVKFGIAGALFSLVIYIIMMTQLERSGFITGAVWCAIGVIFYLIYANTGSGKVRIQKADEELAAWQSEQREEPDKATKASMDRQFRRWFIVATIGMVIALALYIVPYLIA